MNGRLFAVALCVVGVIILLVGGLGISDGIGGVMPNERGARLVGGAMLLVGIALLVPWRRSRRPP